MTSPASIAKHPLHPMLVALPIGLWIFSFLSDVIYLLRWGGGSVWEDVAYSRGPEVWCQPCLRLCQV